MALRVPRGVVSIKIPKDEGGWGRRKVRRVEGPRARERRGAEGRNIDIQKGKGTSTEVDFDPKEVRSRIRRRKITKRPRRVR